MGPLGAPCRWFLGLRVDCPRRVLSRGSSSVVFREVSVVEVREVLRGWLEGAGLRKVAERAGVDRKTGRRYVTAGQAEGLNTALVSRRDR